MKKKNMVVGPVLSPDWIKKVGTMLAEIFRQMALWFQDPSKGLSLDQLQLFIEHRNPFAKATTVIADVFSEVRRDWEKFFKDIFQLQVDLSGVRIPKCPCPDWRLLFLVPGLMPEQAFQISKQIFGKAWKYYEASLNEAIAKNERDPNKDGAYAIWVRSSQEADEVHKNKSADKVESEKLKTETGLERLVHGFKYFRETGKHLDVNTVTLCAGSRYAGGNVPSVDWHEFDGELKVHYCHPGYADDFLRVREVVS